MRLGAAGPGPRVGSERVNDHAGAMKAPGPNMRTRIPPIRFKVCLIACTEMDCVRVCWMSDIRGYILLQHEMEHVLNIDCKRVEH